MVQFEGEVKWLTLEEAMSSKGSAKDAQEYLQKLAYASSRFGGARAGDTSSVRGVILLAKTDIGWLYQGLAERKDACGPPDEDCQLDPRVDYEAVEPAPADD